MLPDLASARNDGSGGNWFTTTHWSLVLTAHGATAGAREALEELCRTYWGPIYAYVRRQGHPPDDAQDFTQEFFARFLANQSFGQADPAHGRFRTFLLTSLKNFLVSEWRRESRAKRADGRRLLPLNTDGAEQSYASEPVDHLSPDKLYERRWALTLINRVLDRLAEDYRAADKGLLFEKMKDCIWGDQNAASYADMAAQLGLTEGAVKVNVHRLRQRCREQLRAEIAHTVARPEEIDDELHHLVEVFSG
jgi:RNA polymerase sigma-70 factor (ECF subfamily)